MATATACMDKTVNDSSIGMVKNVQLTHNVSIPIVGHLITDEDIGVLEGTKMQTVPLKKVIKLLTDPHSEKLLERHLNVLNKLIRQYKCGFVLKELVSVFKILNECGDRIEEEPAYVEPMVELLRLCATPFLKERTSDESTYEQIAVQAVTQLGYLMRVPNSTIRKELCATIVKFYCWPAPAPQVQRHQHAPLSFNKRIVELSDIAETMSLALIDNDLDVTLVVLDVMQKLSHKSEKNCHQMLKANAAARLCKSMMNDDPSGQTLFRSVDVLWNLLENGDSLEVATQLNDKDCINKLQTAFIQQVSQGYSHYDRQLRNDLLVLVTFVASCSARAPFVETGFVHKLVLFATFQEVKSHHALVKHLKLFQNSEDFELKKLLLNLLVVLSWDPSVIQIYSEGHLLLALLSYVKANEHTSGPRDWTVAQFEELQLHALSALVTLGPLMVEDFNTCQGCTRLLLMLEWCSTPDNFTGSGNGFHGEGGRGNKRAQMRYCLRLLRSMVSSGMETILQDLCDQGAINQLTSVLHNYLLMKSDNEEAIDIKMQADMLFILSAVCETDMHRKELFGTQGVDIVVEFLQISPAKLNSGLGHHQLLLAAVDCVWCAIVGCYVIEDYFLEKEGVFILLDLLESCPLSMQNLLLGCLLDLMENPKCRSHVITWRGRNDITAPHLLCETWREEENTWRVSRLEDGCIGDVSFPLAGKIQREQDITPLPAAQPSRVIVEVAENKRAKIYALFCKIGFVDLPGLDTPDLITLTIIEHYLDIKVWEELIHELGREDVRPVSPDQDALEAIQKTVRDRAEYVLHIQKELLETQQKQDMQDEQQHYAQVRENFRQQEKAMRDFQEFVARTSSYDLLKAARQRQDMSIDASRVQTNYRNSDTFHSTDLPNLNTTTFSSRRVKVESIPYSATQSAKLSLQRETSELSNF